MRKILIAAFAIAFVSVQAVSRLRTVVRERAEVAEITSLPRSGDFEFVGCFADRGARAIPTYNGDVRTADACRAKAEANKHDVFGLQYGGQCFTGKLDTVFDKYGKGPAAECNRPLGGTWTNMVYKKKIFADAGEWTYKGCFKDNSARTIPNYLGEVKTREECQRLADSKGFNTIGLQFYSQCFAGKSPAYERLGAATNCGTMGTAWTNNVYVKGERKDEYHYKGCFKDNGTRMVPNFLGNVASVDACKDLAIKGKFDTFSLQYGGQCFVGNKSAYNKLGEETNKANCPTLGGTWSNQVYVLA